MALDPALLSTLRVGELPPALFSLTDNLAHEVGTDLKKGTVQELVNLIAPLVSALQFQVIELDVTPSYIIANFDNTGLGKNLCLGYAICNGSNGTKNRNGLVSLGYGVGYTAIGGTGGSRNAVLVAHSHSVTQSSGDTDGATFSPGNGSIGTQNTSTEGVSGIDKNMQPYIITLMIQKL
tara:strand:+ start:415 stop:951 length:537 start_codon:yes stop_codon:yes gene_type:complete